MSTGRRKNGNRSVAEVPRPRDPDRKRVLNVLAQRRYRERKRQRLAELEAEVRSLQSDSSGTRPIAVAEPFQSQSQRTEGINTGGAITYPAELQLDIEHLSGQTSSFAVQGLQPTGWQALPLGESPLLSDSCLPTPLDSDDSAAIFGVISPVNFDSHLQLLTFQCQSPNDVADRQAFLFQSPSTPDVNQIFHGTPNIGRETPDRDPDNATMAHQPNFPPSSSPLASSTLIHTNQLDPSSLAHDPQSDVSVLEMPAIKVLKAGLLIVSMLNCTATQVWDPFFQHVIPSQPPGLPPHFNVTRAQQDIPHHPVFDIIPWASARTKFIYIFSQPLELRPPSARDPLAVMQLIMDMDDEAEGMRISGEHGWDSRNWEVGELFFRNWWWALDREIIENSNRLRARRGAGNLRLPGT